MSIYSDDRYHDESERGAKAPHTLRNAHGNGIDVGCEEYEERTTEHARRLEKLVWALVDPDPCEFDHHGGCQAHGFLDLEPGEKCPNAEALALFQPPPPAPMFTKSDKETA